jgi:hypothetical protein
VSWQEFEHTSAVADDFKAGVGARLQKMLEDRGKDERNWVCFWRAVVGLRCHLCLNLLVHATQLEEWWEYFAYLQPRYPTAININWQGVMPGAWGSLVVSQAEAAAMFTRHILKFRETLVRCVRCVLRVCVGPSLS